MSDASVVKPKVQKVVLAYSGGLDTSVIVPWLIENYGCEVICYTADVGQGEETSHLPEKAKASGASKLIIEDLREEFARDYLFPLLRSGAVYERRYLLGTSIARPLIAKHQVMVAQQEGADAVAHGCTGKGNDQVRFELTFMALDPRLKVIAPWREWTIRSREDALAYAKEHNVPVTASLKSIYSRDRNLWHLSHEGGLLEDPWQEPDEEMFQLSVSPEKAPDQPEYVEIDFEQGFPTKINGKAFSPANLIAELNVIGGRNGIGRVDLVENRLVGMKSHGVYETPGGTILVAAHHELESITLDRETLHYKDVVAQQYAEMVYYGQWFTPLREALDAFFDKTQETMTGSVRLKLYKGNVIPVGRKSPFSLYREDFATFGKDDVYDQSDAEGFIRLFGLPMKVQAFRRIVAVTHEKYDSPDYSKFERD
jgi:argininosuccinate synthase